MPPATYRRAGGGHSSNRPIARRGARLLRRTSGKGAAASAPSFSPLSLTPALWIDPSDAASVTISGSSGAYIGANGLVHSGVAANYAQGPIAGISNPLVDIDCRAKLTATDWTPAQYMGIISNRDPSAGASGWCFMVNMTTGGLNFAIDGVAAYDSTANPSFVDGTANWVRFTRQQSSGDIKFYTSSDGSSWTQLGATVAGSTAAITTPTTALRIGSLDFTGTNYPWVGTVHRVWMYSDLTETTKVFDADFENATPFVSAFTESALGAPVYVVSSTATSSTASYGYVGPLGLVLPGTSGNVATTPDSVAVSPTASVEIVVRAQAVWSGTCVLLSKRAGGAAASAAGMQVFFSGGAFGFFSNSVTRSVTHALTDGSWYWLKMTSDGTATAFYYAADQATEPSSWTQIGATQGAGSFVDTDHLFSIGGDSQSGWSPSRIKRLILRKTIGGSADFDADFTTAADYCTSFTESSSNAATVTITASNTPANAAGACVSQINDKSGNNRHLTQGTLANMPKYWNGIAGNNVLVFDGANDTLSVAGSIVSQPNTIAIAARSTSSNDHIFGGGSGAVQELYDVSGATIRASAGLEMFGPATTTTVRHVYVVTVNGASSKVRIDGGAGSSGNMSTGNLTNGFRVSGNSAGSFPMAGEVQDVVITSGAMGLTDLNNLGPYMATKAGTTWSTAS